MSLPPLPLVDLSNGAAGLSGRLALARSMEQAFIRAGFLYVRGHGLPDARIEQAFAVSKAFFAEPEPFKRRFAYTDAATNFGYQRLETESLDPRAEPDLKESFTLCHVPAVPASSDRWPGAPFQEAAARLFDAGLALGHQILELLGTALELQPGFFADRHRGEGVTLRLLHYPANPVRRADTQLGAGAHTDYGSITLLFQDDIGGLEVQDSQGNWLPAPRIEGAVLVNAGDLLERWSNGRFRSTRHRVQAVAGPHDRYSIALFVDPDPDVEIACLPTCCSPEQPPRHPPIRTREHIRQKLTATHIALKT